MMAEKCSWYKIYRRMSDEVRKIKQMFTNRLKMGLSLWAWVEKTVLWMESHWLTGNEKVLGAVVTLIVFRDIKSLTINFLAKDATINTLSGKVNILGAVVSKEGHADSWWGHLRTRHNWFPWKRCNCKQCFLLPIYLAIFTLFIEWPLCIWIHIVFYLCGLSANLLIIYIFHSSTGDITCSCVY